MTRYFEYRSINWKFDRMRSNQIESNGTESSDLVGEEERKKERKKGGGEMEGKKGVNWRVDSSRL